MIARIRRGSVATMSEVAEGAWFMGYGAYLCFGLKHLRAALRFTGKKREKGIARKVSRRVTACGQCQ